jgi:hypothetical protein
VDAAFRVDRRNAQEDAEKGILKRAVERNRLSKKRAVVTASNT